MASEPTTAELLRRAIENRLLDLHTQIPAVVDSYDENTQTIDARVALKRAIASDTEATRFEDIGILRNIPVMFPRGGRNLDQGRPGFCITWPLAPGDPVRLVFDEAYAGQYRDTGVVPSEPGFVGRFNLSSCVAFPGSGADKDALQAVTGEETMVIGVDGAASGGGSPAQIHITMGESGATIKLGPDVTSRIALANKVATAVQQIIDLLKAGGAWTPVPNDGGAALQAAAASLVNVTETSVGAVRVYGQ